MISATKTHLSVMVKQRKQSYTHKCYYWMYPFLSVFILNHRLKWSHHLQYWQSLLPCFLSCCQCPRIMALLFLPYSRYNLFTALKLSVLLILASFLTSVKLKILLHTAKYPLNLIHMSSSVSIRSTALFCALAILSTTFLSRISLYF